jgi:hypothetical protein
MAPKKGKETLLDLCNRSTAQGNTISVRMLEYLSTVKEPPLGFRELSVNFLEICRVLYAIEAGLQEASRAHSQFPQDMQQELDKKLRGTQDDFIVLNQMLSKFLESEKKGSFGRFRKMMFADTDCHKLNQSLGKTREALGMSSMVFRWYLGDEKAEASLGIGVTALAAALDRLNPSGVRHNTPTSPRPMLPPAVSEPPPSTLPPLPTLPLTEKFSESDLLGRLRLEEDDNTTISGTIRDPRHSFSRPAPSTKSSKMTVSSATRDLAALRDESVTRSTEASDDRSHFSSLTSDSFAHIEDMIGDIGSEKHAGPSPTVSYVKSDPGTVPRWTPKQTSGQNSAALKSTLLNAVQQKKHKLMEQLLDCGVSPDGESGHSLLREAILQHDIEGVRLLLLFG